MFRFKFEASWPHFMEFMDVGVEGWCCTL
jgi:hypothetical protein